MNIQYFPTQYGSLILNPKTLEGITFDKTNISQISLFHAGGVPLYITEELHITTPKPYHYTKINKRTWERLNDYVTEGQETKAREIIEKIKEQTKDIPQFIQESGNTHNRKEYQVINPAA